MIRLHKFRATLVILGVLASYGIVEGQTPTADQDPRVGTWKLNLEKSQFAEGTAPKMQLRRVHIRPDGFIVFTLTGQDAQSNPMFIQTTYKLDGKEYPEYTQTSLAEFSATGTKPIMNTYKLVDPFTVEITRRDVTGKVTGTNTQVMAKDGRTLTATARDTSGKVVVVQVSDRQ